MKVWVDSSYFIALTDKSDKHFEAARDFILSPALEGVALITSNLIIAETITRLTYRAGHKYAKEFGEKFRHSKIVQTIWADRFLDEEAWKIFIKYEDKDFSYVDCLSFAGMKRNKIDHALSFDKHFRQMGFHCLP